MKPWFDGFYVLEVGAGQVLAEGKSYYPNGVHAIVPRRRAIEMIQEIAAQLTDSEREEIHLSLAGKMEVGE